LIIGLAVICMAAAPRAAWAQWSGTNPVWTNSNVGIGTGSPSTPLHVFSNSYPQATIQSAAGETSAALNLSPSGVGARAYRLLAGTDGSFHLYDLGASTSRLYITPGGYVTFPSGNVGIGTTNPGSFKLAVEGTIGARDVMVTNASPWPDYVFRTGYRLRPLSEVSQFIQTNGHLPDIPTEAEVKEKGVSLGDMQAKLLAKVEELTLHMIQSDERNNRLEQQNQDLRDQMNQQTKEIKELRERLTKGATTDSTPAVAK
jgi:hypothetical protein